MNNMFQKILLLIMGIYSCLDAFEVNTHQALTRCAITSSCSNGSSKNLESFVNHAGLNSKTYANEIFEKYGESYQKYANDGAGFGDWGIVIKTPNYLGMIEAGSVLEDAVYPVHDHAGDGRFNNHFYAAQFNSQRNCRFAGYMLSSRALCTGYGKRTDNIDWVFNDKVQLNRRMGKARKNDYGLSDAFKYYKLSFEGNTSNRKKYQAKLFVTLGHVVHMLQDLHSPAHCRDNSHMDGDYMEIYGRYNGGFNMRGGKFNPANNYWIKEAIRKNGSSASLMRDNRYYTYEDFFKKAAIWVGNNFASESHFNFFVDKINTQTGSGLSINNYLDKASLFDGRNTHPNKSETFESPINNTRLAYVYTEGNTVAGSVKGVIPSNASKIGMVEHGILFDRYHMVAPYYKKINNKLVQTGLNKSALESTAVNVMPRAVAATQAFLDFFFRGQMEVSINTEGILTIKNVSDPSRVSHKDLLTFKTGGRFRVYYYDASTGSNVLLNEHECSFGDIPVGVTRTLDLKSDFLAKKLPEGTKITVLYDGQVGTYLGGYNSYKIGLRGLAVDVVRLPAIKRPDNYTFTIKGRGEYFPYPARPVSDFSFDVYVYNHGKLKQKIALNNLLKLAWYDGSAHFNSNLMHHYDVWCQGAVPLCNYLRATVPTDSGVGYKNWKIDWTIWAAGSRGTNFITNIHHQIAKYYATRYQAQTRSAKYVSKEDEAISPKWIDDEKKIPEGLDEASLSHSDVRVYKISSQEDGSEQVEDEQEKDEALEAMINEAEEAEQREIEESQEEFTYEDKVADEEITSPE
jgi:hypothetical protein